jgi:hypothetical protein
MEKSYVNYKITKVVKAMSIKKLERASVGDIAKFIDYSILCEILSIKISHKGSPF